VLEGICSRELAISPLRASASNTQPVVEFNAASMVGSN
jgi:hypothetical protein